MLGKAGRLLSCQLASLLVLASALISVSEPRAQEPGTFHKEIPAMPEPVGQHLNRFISVQTNNAAPARFIFFPNEWYMGGHELGPMGTQHLLAVAHAPVAGACPIVVEASCNQELDEARRLQIVMDLQRLGMQDADHRVVVGPSSGAGLRGEQAELTYRSWLTWGNNDWNRGLGYGGLGYLGGYGPGTWGQGFWGLGTGGGYGYNGLFSMPYRN